MAKEMEKNDEKPFRRKNVSAGKAVIIFIFILGFILGALVSAYFLYPEMNSQFLQEKSNVEVKNSLLEQQVSAYLQCLQSNGVDVRNCSSS